MEEADKPFLYSNTWPLKQKNEEKPQNRHISNYLHALVAFSQPAKPNKTSRQPTEDL